MEWWDRIDLAYDRQTDVNTVTNRRFRKTWGISWLEA
jgi:hypothetical protein